MSLVGDLLLLDIEIVLRMATVVRASPACYSSSITKMFSLFLTNSYFFGLVSTAAIYYQKP